ncbi:MAG: GAF domain-containing protein [Ectothiorhodospiraceae bacterium]|nr:GAF domain-containing protein [Ectothiorhodospiraceae bacterium]
MHSASAVTTVLAMPSPLELADRVERLERRARAQASLLDALAELLAPAARGAAPEAILAMLDTSLPCAVAAVDATDGSILVRDDANSALAFVATAGSIPTQRLRWTYLPSHRGIASWVTANGQAAIVNDVRADERFYPGIDEVHAFHTRTVLAVPVIHGGNVLGVVEVLNKRGNRLFDTSDKRAIEVYAHCIGRTLAHLAAGQDRPAAAQTSRVAVSS